VGAAVFCCGWGGNHFTPLLLMYRELDGYSDVTVDAFLATYVLGLVPGLLIAGSASDRFGRKPLMVGGTALSAVASVVLAGGSAGVVPIYAGRFLAGIAVGIAMAVGTSWVKELSQAPFDMRADPGAGARRASLSVTAGFGLGAGVAGVLAQWGPWPTVSPYLVHVLVTVPPLLGLARVPETRSGVRPAGGFWADLKVPAAGHRRFVRVVLPMAPWIFAGPGVAYATMPQLVADRVGPWGLAYATLLTVVTLAVGVLVQPLAKRVGARSTGRAILIAMGLMALGMGVGALNAAERSPWLGLTAAVPLGAAYGIAMVSGLVEIQRIATAEDLAGLTGVYYALAYTGFLLPTVLAALSSVASYTEGLTAVAFLALVCLLVIRVAGRATAAPVSVSGDGPPGVAAEGRARSVCR
jgi:hypothetical protein